MTKALANVRIYGDDAGAVSVAPKGTTPPVGLAAPSAAHVELGWMSEDGVPVSRSNDSSTFRAWQGGAVVRKRVTSNDDTFKFQALEETATSVGLYYAGATFSTAAGVTTIAVPGGARGDERAWLLDFHDGQFHKRYVIPLGEVTNREEISHKNDAMTIYGYTVSIYGDFFIVSDNPALATV